MVLTPSYRRRTAGFTALFAALLLVLTALFAISPVSASEVTPSSPCDQHGYEKFNSSSGSEVLEWGSMTWGQAGSENVLSYDIEPGYTVEFCIKAGNVDNTFSGPRTGVGIVTHDNPDISHVGYRVVGTPTEVTPEEPGFTDPDCDTEAAVDLPETVGVDYGIVGDIAPGGTVTVTATPQAGYEFPAGATTVWEHTFGEVPEDCDPPVEVTTDEPTFTDPTCDVNEVGLTLPETTGVVYTVTGDQEPGGTVTVTATAADGYVLADDAETQWEHTYGPLATDCGGAGGSVTDPAASVLVTCEVAQIVLDNTASDVAVTYTITGVDGYSTVEVPAGEQQVIDDLGLAEDADYDITVAANGIDDATAAGTYDCVTPTTTPPTVTPPSTDVSPDVVEKPAPQPAPTAQPAAQAAAQELPATGLGSTELLLLALLMLGLGAAALLGSDPRRQN